MAISIDLPLKVRFGKKHQKESIRHASVMEIIIGKQVLITETDYEEMSHRIVGTSLLF